MGKKKEEVRDKHIYVRLREQHFNKAKKFKEERGQSWVVYIERLIEKDKASAIQK